MQEQISSLVGYDCVNFIISSWKAFQLYAIPSSCGPATFPPNYCYLSAGQKGAKERSYLIKGHQNLI